jgi:hypothetical protein
VGITWCSHDKARSCAQFKGGGMGIKGLLVVRSRGEMLKELCPTSVYKKTLSLL